MQREQGDALGLNGERRHDVDGSVIVGVSSQTPDLRRMLEFAAEEANRRRVDLTLVHGCSPIPMPTTLEPTTPLADREVRWLKRLGKTAELAEELLDPDRTVDVLVHPGTGVHALVEASAAASLVVLQRRRISRGRRIRTGSTSALVAVRSQAPVAVLSASDRSLPAMGNVVGRSRRGCSFLSSECGLRRSGASADRTTGRARVAAQANEPCSSTDPPRKTSSGGNSERRNKVLSSTCARGPAGIHRCRSTTSCSPCRRPRVCSWRHPKASCSSSAGTGAAPSAPSASAPWLVDVWPRRPARFWSPARVNGSTCPACSRPDPSRDHAARALFRASRGRRFPMYIYVGNPRCTQEVTWVQRQETGYSATARFVS